MLKRCLAAALSLSLVPSGPAFGQQLAVSMGRTPAPLVVPQVPLTSSSEGAPERVSLGADIPAPFLPAPSLEAAASPPIGSQRLEPAPRLDETFPPPIVQAPALAGQDSPPAPSPAGEVVARVEKSLPKEEQGASEHSVEPSSSYGLWGVFFDLGGGRKEGPEPALADAPHEGLLRVGRGLASAPGPRPKASRSVEDAALAFGGVALAAAPAFPVAAVLTAAAIAATAAAGAWIAHNVLAVKKGAHFQLARFSAGALAAFAAAALSAVDPSPALALALGLGIVALLAPILNPSAARILARKASSQLFPVYSRDGQFYMALGPGQLEKPFLLSGTIEKGLGEKLLYGAFPAGERLVFLRRAGDKIQLVAKNMDFRAEPGSPMERALERSMGDSILATVPIAEEDSGVVAFRVKDMFLTDLFDLRSQVNELYDAKEDYALDEKAGTLSEAKAFPKNVELKAELVFSTPEGDRSSYLPDTRNLNFGMRYSLSALPEDGYVPRPADERVGYFSTVFQDWSDPAKEDVHTRLIHRWKLEKTDPAAAVSPVKEPIVWWIENSVPHRFREAVKRGILAWNRAFERVGLKDAIVVRQQPDPGEAPVAGFDPADARFNVFRWYLGMDATFAMGPIRVDPRSGRIYNAGVMFSGAMTGPVERLIDIMQETLDPLQGDEDGHRHAGKEERCGAGGCRAASTGARELAFALSLSALAGKLGPEERERLIGDYITDITLHEIGHTLGLRHNFLAGTYKTAEELHQVKDGVLAASVMDYLPLNVSPPGKPQGSYFQTDLGPYDYLAVEYGYAPSADLAAVAARTQEPGLGWAGDEEAWAEMDPDIQVFDIGKDPLQYAVNSAYTVIHYWTKLQKREPAPGESYEALLRGYWYGWRRYFQTVRIAVNYLGGIKHRRVRAGAPEPPLELVPAEKQREALDFLNRVVFSDDPFQLDPAFAARLALDRKPVVGNLYPALQHPPYKQLVSVLRRYTLALMFDSQRLDRLSESEALFKGGDLFSLFELFTKTNVLIWRNLFDVNQALGRKARGRKPKPPSIDIPAPQRELQLAHIDALGSVVSDDDAPEDARTFASDALNDLHNLSGNILNAHTAGRVQMHDIDLAHLREVYERSEAAKSEIRKILGSALRRRSD